MNPDVSRKNSPSIAAQNSNYVHGDALITQRM